VAPKLFYATQLLYILSKVLTKISLLVFFLRVFPQRWFRLATLITIAWVAVHGLVFLLLIGFQCTPIQSIWDTGLDRKCLNRTLIVYAGAGSSIFEDLVILVLPMPCVSALKIGPAKRFSMIVMFCVGSLYVFHLLSSTAIVDSAPPLTSLQCVRHQHDPSEISVWIRRH
jgi:hypothetical protein